MKTFLSKAVLLMMLVLLAAFANSSGQGIPAGVHYIPHDQVAAVMAKGGPIVNDPGLIVLANHRDAGKAEYHEHTSHVFIMVEGEATFITGGKLIDPKETAPGETRAAAIEGGQSYHLTKGDVITIPEKTPHWWKEIPTKTVSYYAVNIVSK
jgi:mannose-6-phosphate isomerase-like protein (cupin superfamily)